MAYIHDDNRAIALLDANVQGVLAEEIMQIIPLNINNIPPIQDIILPPQPPLILAQLNPEDLFYQPSNPAHDSYTILQDTMFTDIESLKLKLSQEVLTPNPLLEKVSFLQNDEIAKILKETLDFHTDIDSKIFNIKIDDLYTQGYTAQPNVRQEACDIPEAMACMSDHSSDHLTLEILGNDSTDMMV